MLEDSLFESQDRGKKRNPMTVVLSVTAHLATVALLVLIPLIQTQALPIPPMDPSLFLPRIERPRGIEAYTVRPIARRLSEAKPEGSAFTAPSAIPNEVGREVKAPTSSDLPALPFGETGNNLPLLTNFGKDDSPSGPVPAVFPPSLPAPPPPPIVKTERIRQHSSVQSANLIYQVKPAYPPIARQTRTQGVVVLEAIIDRDGSIQSLRVISGHPLLTQAALDAVKQWKYRPTLLNGEPIEVITTVTVNFTLQ